MIKFLLDSNNQKSALELTEQCITNDLANVKSLEYYSELQEQQNIADKAIYYLDKAVF